MALTAEYSDHYAKDISKNIIKGGELFDTEVISQSIEMIILTMFGERLFKPQFGSAIWLTLFEDFTVANGEKLIDGIVASIKKYEDRVRVIESAISLDMKQDEHALKISLPYVILRSGQVSYFKKKIFV